MEEKEYTREERLEIEERAIQALLQYGVKFSVPLKIKPKEVPKWIRVWNKYFPKHVKVWRDKRIPKKWNLDIVEIPDVNTGRSVKTYMRYFHIKPLYLGTIDLIRMLSIEMEYDETKIQEKPFEESNRLLKYQKLMAKIAAIATLNSCEAAKQDSKEVKELQNFFLSHLTSSRLQKLFVTIDRMSDKAGFTNSIRLISPAGTTVPKADRVEL
ncbi:MAG TPA: hypothetical protein DDW85_01575 [Porphyromonadaceae bacterium]|nr:hypothetical protein [Porphyromonadaceae bacterium]